MISTAERSSLRTKLRARKKVFVGWHSLSHPSITEIFTQCGFDFIGIDLEHSTISQEQSQRIMTACQAAGICCIPRVASHNGEMIKRLLDSGADGIMIPMVSTAEEVECIIDWCKYSPVGKRSFGVGRAQRFGFDYDEYTTNWNDSSSIIIQIETIEGVENIDVLLEYEEVDGAMVGPYDLSGSLGIPGQLDHPKVVQARKRVNEACLRYGKASGTHLVYPDHQQIHQAFLEGFTFIVLSSDIFLLWKWAEQTREHIESFREK